MTWRTYANWARRWPALVKLADPLGRGHGRLRLIDHLFPAPAPAKHRPNLLGWHERGLSAVAVGHATVLLRIGGMTVLTDPVFSSRIGLCGGLATIGPFRQVAPALTIGKLPKLDLILISHAHFDHLDRPTLQKLDKRTPVVTSTGNDDLIRDLGFRRVKGLHCKMALRVGSLVVSAVPVRHWGPRMFVDRHRGYAAFLIESNRHRALFGADTADGDQFDHLRDQGIDLAMLGISAYEPYIAAHATPEQAWGMFRRMDAKWLMPMHHSTFRLSHEPMDEPLRRLRAVADHSRLVADEVGMTFTAD